MISISGSTRRGSALGLVLALLAGLVLGTLVGPVVVARFFPSNSVERSSEGATPGQVWECGMNNQHPPVVQNHPGNCPICGMKLTPRKPAATNGSRDAIAGASTVTISPVVVQNMGVRVATVEEGPLRATIRTSGIARDVDARRHDVTLKIGGFVETLHADTEGMHVAVGDPLFEIYSPEILVAEQELITARRAVERATAASDASSRRATQDLLDTARRKLELWGLDREQVETIAAAESATGRATFRSAYRGFLMEKSIVQGSAVQAGERLLRIDDHDVLWLEAAIFESEHAWIRLGQTVRATFAAMPGETVEGEIVWISPEIDEKTRAGKIRIEIANPHHHLHPGMFATATIDVLRADRAILVPRDAVIDTGVRQVAFVSLGSGRFEPRVVHMGLSAADARVQILDGLAPGETVVTSGQFLIDSESRREAAIRRMSEHGLVAPPADHSGHGGR